MDVLDILVKSRVWKANDANGLAALLRWVSVWLDETPGIAIQDIAVWLDDDRSAITVYYIDAPWLRE